MDATTMPGIDRTPRARTIKPRSRKMSPARSTGETRRRCRLVEPGKGGDHRRAQRPMDPFGRHGPIRIGLDGVWLRQFDPGGPEELALAQDSVPAQSSVSLVECAGAQRPRLKVWRQRAAGAGRGHREIERPVFVQRLLAVAQHIPKLRPQRGLELCPEHAR
jgi:hypothetical protein